MGEEMSGLAQSIVASYDVRATGLVSIRRDVSANRERARRHVEELGTTRQKAASTLHNHLAKVHTDLNRGETGRKARFYSWIEGVAAAHNAAREEWQNLTATMQAKRAGAVAVAEAPPRVASVAAVEDTVEVGEVTEELASLTPRVFTYLTNHPDGTRLSEIEREFGLGRFQAAGVVKHLIDEGKAKKEGLLYFAI